MLGSCNIFEVGSARTHGLGMLRAAFGSASGAASGLKVFPGLWTASLHKLRRPVAFAMTMT